MFEEIDTYNIKILRYLASIMDISPKLEQKIMLEKIKQKLLKYYNGKKKSMEKYKKKQQIGNKGKDGKTFLVLDKFDYEYAMKTFRTNKSSEKIITEVTLQRKCSVLGICPKIIDFDIHNKYIVMEKMDHHLFDEIKKKNGLLSESRQNELIRIFKMLDKAKVFHADANILNYMIRGDKLYIIDFGMSKEINPKLVDQLKTSTPNYEMMLLGFILKLKDMNCPPESYKVLKQHLSEEKRKIYNII